jgi:hypothetical protein
MGDTFQRGTPITLIERFWTIDALTEAKVPANPSTVTFILLAPDGTEQTFAWPDDPAVTNPAVGVFVCAISVPPLPPGEYRYRVEGAGTVVAVREGTFTVVESGVLEPVDSTVAQPGPCSSWINGDDVAEFDPSLGVGSDTWKLDDVAYGASSLMYELSGRQFPGVCQRTVRPCRSGCSCWGGYAIGGSPFFWTTTDIGGAWWGWRNEGGEQCGCGTESYVRLAGYPVREILEVKIDGTALDPSEYRLDQRRFLIRTADLTTSPPTDRFWPLCQDLSLPDTEPGTYSVTYTWGADVPLAGRWAAAQLAAELWRAFPANAGDCKLPAKVTRVVRQGITMERLVPTADLLRNGQTGLPLVDSFIALVNPTKARRRSAVWSPDLQPFARRVGQ